MEVNSVEIKALRELSDWPRASLAQLPTPMHRLKNFAEHLGGLDLWIKRDDLTGLAGGGNKTRKLEFLIGDAISKKHDVLVTVGAIQSNHTRQTAAAAAKLGMRCALMHAGWTEDSGPFYREAGNILYSKLMGAELYEDTVKRPIEDETPLDDLVQHLKDKGDNPYLIPGGASDHPLGGLGYVVCAAEIVEQAAAEGKQFDYVVHCTGSSGTQAGLVAGFSALNVKTKVIGIPDDDETEIKKKRVRRIANDTLELLGKSPVITESDIEIVVGDTGDYGISDKDTFETIKLFASTEGLIADPVYEGKAVRGLRQLVKENRFEKGSKVLLMHLGGEPATHGYANKYGEIKLKNIPSLK
ncbi:1-aminocyclopropane-1-carboxylate deaminase [Marinomonas pollencensis]|uniref:1-aminocyclopropane-1-carboxylate deaminase n=2 Tax=Marinomonas pollencensis TaxID=491954 RepID=A0A3E0DHV9_9GAMM|nr:1-aminocyclopropane-1-carboxylate deaminase [Marinomonas pollencensis]